MNRTGKIILVAWAVAVVGLLVYPPWRTPAHTESVSRHTFYFDARTRYEWIFDAPDTATPDWSRIGLELVALSFVAGMLLLLVGRREKAHPLVLNEEVEGK